MIARAAVRRITECFAAGSEQVTRATDNPTSSQTAKLSSIVTT
jgi:hypothetical protein